MRFFIKNKIVSYKSLLKKMWSPNIASLNESMNPLKFHQDKDLVSKKISDLRPYYDTVEHTQKNDKRTPSANMHLWKLFGGALLGIGLFSQFSKNYTTALAEEEKLLEFTPEWLEREFAKEKSFEERAILDLRSFELGSDDLAILYKELQSHSEVLRVIWPEKLLNNLKLKNKINDIQTLLIQHQTVFVDRPSDYIYAYFSQEVYHDNGGTLPTESGWECLKTRKVDSNGYFGAAYRNTQTHHIIIAHRGTDPANVVEFVKDWCTNIENVIGHAVNAQEASAVEFAKEIKKEYGTQYHISFAGHSLGGFLAQITTYHFAREGYITNAVVIDSPGAREKLLKLEGKKQSDEIEKLNITSYLAPPNLVNTCNSHLGVYYRVYPKLKLSEGGLFSSFKNGLTKNYLYSVMIHGREGIVDLFDPTTGLPKEGKFKKIEQWPQVSLVDSSSLKNLSFFKQARNIVSRYISGETDFSEYELFHRFANNDNYEPIADKLPFSEKYFIAYKAHYITEVVDIRKVYLNQLSIKEQKFLENFLNADYDFKGEKLKSLLKNLKILGLTLPELQKLDDIIIVEKGVILVPASFSDAQKFRCYLTCLIRRYYELPERNFHECFVDERVASGIETLKQQPLSADPQPFMKTLEQLNQDMHQYWEENHKTLKDIKQKGLQARLYLYVDPTLKELQADEEQKNRLEKQLEYRLRLQKEIEQHRAFVMTLPDTNDTKKALYELDRIKKDLEEQTQIINIIYPFQEAVWQYKQHRYGKAKMNLEKAQKVIEGKELLLSMVSKQINPESLYIGIYNLRAKIARSEGDYPGVKHYYEKALDYDPNNAVIKSSLGAALDDWDFYDTIIPDKDKNRYGEAIPYLKAALKEDPQNPTLIMNWGRGLYLLAQAKRAGNLKAQEVIEYTEIKETELLEEAEIQLSHSLKLNQNNLTALLFRGIIHQEQGDLKGALADFEAGLQLQKQPDHPTLLCRKAEVLIQIGGEESAAYEAYQEAYRSLKAKSWVPKNEREFWLKKITDAMDLLNMNGINCGKK
jgi:tetratricopeptide (TPR) repeat protein